MQKITHTLKKYFLLIGLILLVSTTFAQNRGLVQGKVRIKLSADIQPVVEKNLKISLNSTGEIHTGIKQIDILNKEYKAVKMRRIFPYAGKNEAKHIKHGLNLWYELDVDNTADLNSVANKYLTTAEVIAAEPIYAKVLAENNPIVASEAAKTDGLPTNDPRLGDQWHYNNTGDEEGYVAGADISLFDAWQQTKGSSNVIVAIVDGGIDVNHEDLKDNVWINEAELNGKPGVDDDNNGYIDDINGFNFPSFKGEITPHFHGTHVAGTVSAVSNNGVGVAGVAGGSGNGDGTRIMSCQTFSDENGSGYFAPAIVYGADNGAVISQNSWGYKTPGIIEQVILDAIDYFREEAGNYEGSPMRGGVVFFSAGNDGKDDEYYPGHYESTISVASVGPSNEKAGYSNFGEWVDITAPGGDMTFGLRGQILSTLPGNEYGYLQGTSMACPHVSGVAALVVAKFGSKIFTNIDLESRMLEGVDDIYASNPGYVGLMGSGLTNASKAMKTNESTPPNDVDDISVKGVSKDFAVLTWTVPIDADDDVPNKYLLYYSENQFTADDLDNTSFVVVKNGSTQVGDIIKGEVKGLKASTKYYFAVKAADRWGNFSGLSQLVTGTTNEGPEIFSETTQANLDVDVSTSNTSSSFFDILNKKNGILQWKLEPRNIRNQESYNRVSYPSNAVTTVTTNAVGIKERRSDNLVATVPTAELQWEPSELKYWQDRYPSYLFGSIDTIYTNSMATKFTIINEEGFNLTHVNALLRGDEVDGPFIIEIYRGSSISDENRIYYDDEYYELHNKGEDYINIRLIKLKENIFLEKDDEIWVVIHSPSNNKYPFGIYPEIQPSYSDNCFWSTDMGQTWVPISAGVGDDGYVWAIALASEMDPLYKYVTVTPENGEIYGVGHQEITYEVEASKLINGTYYSNLVFMSNDDVSPFYRIPLTVNVVGHTPSLSGPQVVEYGRVFTGLSKKLIIPVENNGYGRFITQSATSSNSQFRVVTNPSSLNFAALSGKNIEVEYTPNGVGNDNADIKLVSNKGEVYTFNVFGVGATPAHIELEKSVFDFNDVAVGDDLTAKIIIKNTGKYPLQYGFSGFSESFDHIKEVDVDDKSLGYSYSEQDYPEGYVFNDISKTGTDITKFFIENPQDKHFRIDLGFDFPFYDDVLDSMYITPNGIITSTTKGSTQNQISFMEGYINGYISGLQLSYPALSMTGKITYQKGLGNVTIQYTDFKNAKDNSGVSITFQIILFDNGNIRFVYDKMDGLYPSQQSDYYVAIEGMKVEGGLLLDKVSGEKKIVDITSPGIGIIKTLSEPSGVVSTGSSKEIIMTLDKDKLAEGIYHDKLFVVSNDPFNTSKEIQINVNVTKGGASNLFLNTSSISFGDIINNSVATKTVELTNTGNKDIDVVSVESANSQLSISNSLPVTVKPNQTFYAEVVVNTSTVGAISDVLRISDSEGEVHSLSVDGNIVEAPQVEFSNKDFSETIAVDEVLKKEFIVENKGAGELEYSFVNSSLAKIEANTSAKKTDVPEFTYVSKTSYKNSDVTYRWYNVGEENQLPFRHKDGIYWGDIELPFLFEYYQKKYTTLYVNMQGIVSFDEPERRDVFMFPVVPQLGLDDFLNNCIAPYFSGQDLKSYDISGVYYKVFGDKLVIEWKNLVDRSSLGGPYSFQLILFEDGRIKFQYNSYFPETRGITNLGYIGMENEDASDNLIVAAFTDFIANGVAVEIIPTYKERLAAGESKTYDVVLDATNQFAGNYNQKIAIFSNDPENEYSEINVDLTISGEPKIKFSKDTIDLGPVFISENPATIERFINISNVGVKKLQVRDIHLENNDDIKIQYLYTHPIFGASWKNIDLAHSPSYEIEPEGSLNEELKIVFTGTKEKYLTTPYSNKVIFKTNYGTYKAEILIKAEYQLPPAFTVDKNKIYTIVNGEESVTNKVILGNVEGKADLDYSVVLDYKRVSDEVTDLSKAVNTAELTSLKISEKPIASVNSVNEEFYKVLSYENNIQADSRLGFNGEFIFSAATAFVAPEDGFKLTHVQTYYVPGEVLESDIKIEIRAGSDLGEAPIIHTQTVHHSVSEKDDTGSLLSFELDEDITLLPYERFFVIFSYPQEAVYPQGFAQIEDEILTNTFYVYDGQGSWVDLSITSFNKARLMIRAVQKDATNLKWIEVLEPEGGVAKGTSKDLNFTVYPNNLPLVDNSVDLVISTNDPLNPEEKVAVTIRGNQGPQAQFEYEYRVREADTLNVSIPIVDVEGDAITSVKLAEDYNNVTLSYADGIAKVKYIPTYDDQGLNTFGIETKDDLGLVAINNFEVDVENVNRAPIVIDSTNVVIDTDNLQYKADFLDLFEELDGQAMTFTAEIEDTETAEIYISDKGIVVSPVKTGFTKLHLSATDIDGASVSTTKVVVVNALLSNDELLAAKWGIYPNPVDDELRIELHGLSNDDVTVRILDLSGKLVKYFDKQNYNDIISHSVSDLESGIYIVEVSNIDGKSTHKMIKN